MKKLFLSFAITGALMASNEAVATLTDVKEALYYLIKDYKELKRKNESLSGKFYELNATSQKIKEEVLRNLAKIKSLEANRTILIEPLKKDKNGLIIEEFVKRNSYLLEGENK